MFVHQIVGEEEILIKPLYLILMKNRLGNVKECKTLIKHGRVKVDGKIIRDIKYPIENESIQVNDQWIDNQPFVYYMMNKPRGYICANKDQHYPCLIDLIHRDDCFCVGRLDLDTTGFVLITNDSSLSHQLLLPQKHVEKTYLVETCFPLKQDYEQRFQEGIIIDSSFQCLPSRYQYIDDYHCYVTLFEGKYHQVKKMFLSCKNQVKSLKRISFANILLDEDLKLGEYRNLYQNEFQILKEVLNEKSSFYNE